MGEGYKIRCLSEGAGIDEIIENYLAFGKATPLILLGLSCSFLSSLILIIKKGATIV